MTSVRTCASCRAPLESRQEYCLECGARVAAPARRPRHWLWPAGVAALVATGGAAAAIAAGGHEGDRETIVALSPMRPARAATVDGSKTKPGAALATWPQRDGYTVVVAAVPEAAGREAAAARAREAIAAGLPEVGILQSSRYASLHPGYTLVFSGVYASRDEALLALPRAARRFAGAYAQEIAR